MSETYSVFGGLFGVSHAIAGARESCQGQNFLECMYIEGKHCSVK